MEIPRKIYRNSMSLHLGNIDSRNGLFSDFLHWRFQTVIDDLYPPYVSPRCQLAEKGC